MKAQNLSGKTTHQNWKGMKERITRGAVSLSTESNIRHGVPRDITVTLQEIIC